jgi:ribosomal protein S27E
MSYITIISVGIVLISIMLYFASTKKVKCLMCSCDNVIPTGEKRYKEDNISIWGSPKSFHEIEYKCKKCGNTFWEPKKAVFFY